MHFESYRVHTSLFESRKIRNMRLNLLCYAYMRHKLINNLKYL